MSQTDIEDLSMTDLVELFKRQVKLYGVAKCINFLQFDGVDGGVPKSHEDEKSGPNEDDVVSVPDSVDILSESSNGEESNDDESSADSGNSEDIFSDDEISDDESVHGPIADILHLHDPPVFNTRHCPPLESILETVHSACDCTDFGMDVCGQTDDFQFFEAHFNFSDEHAEATLSADSEDRIHSNKLRKRMYKILFHATDFGILEKNERRKLPNCAVARIRQIYPSITGDYMGFREN
jgi:hypothetical protein